MEIRKVNASVITETVKKLFMDMNYFIGEDILTALKNAGRSADMSGHGHGSSFCGIR